MTDEKSGTRSSVGLLDIATRVPGLLMDAPTILRGVVTGFGARPSAKTSIGKVFQDRAAQLRRQGLPQVRGSRDHLPARPTRPSTATPRCWPRAGSATATSSGSCCATRRDSVLLMLAAVKCGAISGMLNYHQRGDVLTHSLGTAVAKVVVADPDLVEPINESGADTDGLMTLDELQQLAATAPTTNPATTAAVLAKDKAFYIFTSGTTGMPKASVMTHYRWLRALAGFGGLGMRLNSNDTLYCCLPLYHNNALTVALSSVLNAGATLALGKSFSASKFWDDVIRYDATAFVYIGEICAYLLNQPPKPTDRKHQVRVIAGNGLRPAIWDEFTERFGIDRVCEFYAASEGNTAFVNVFNVDKTTGICPTPWRSSSTTTRPANPMRGDDGRVRKVKTGEPGLLLSKVSSFQPFDGYTDKEASREEAGARRLQGGRRLVQHRRPDALAGLRPRRVHRPARRHLPLEGRERRHHRGRGRGVDRPAGRGGHRVRRRGARRRRPGGHGGHPAQGGRGVRRQGAGQGRLRRICRPTRCRCSCGSSRSWRTPRRSRARRSTCARRATAAPRARATRKP